MSGGVYDARLRADALRTLRLPEPLERELRALVGQVLDLTWKEVQEGSTPLPERLRGYWEPYLLNAVAQAIAHELGDVRAHCHHPDDYPRRSE